MDRMAVSNLALYGTSHAIIDASCAAVIFSLLRTYPVTSQNFIFLVILYNVIAFGLQPIIGIASDAVQMPRQAAIYGAILVALSMLVLAISPISAIIIAGFGNALFHVGGGTISLNLTPKKASAPGIYVAPGAIGLVAGGLFGRSGYFMTWPLILALILAIILMTIVKMPRIDYKKKKSSVSFELIIILVFLSIAIRSLIGSVVIFPWRSNIWLLVVLTIAVFLGKAAGGIFADRYGWSRIAVSSLMISAPLLAFGTSYPYLAIIGMFLFNMTMPVTLVAISNTLPGRPGFSFGLTCLAIIIGVFPIYLGISIAASWIIFAIILLSALVLFNGLRIYGDSDKQK